MSDAKDCLAVKLLWRHVGRAADDCGAVRRDLDEARRAEVGHLQEPSVGHEHVARAEIAMNDAVLVCVVNGVADLTRIVERSREIDPAIARDHGLGTLMATFLSIHVSSAR
jgi:hypothetical protein